MCHERECSLQPRNNNSEAPSPHGALQSAPSFSQDVTQKLLCLKSCESALQDEPNFSHSQSPSSEFPLDKQNKALSHLYVDSLSHLRYDGTTLSKDLVSRGHLCIFIDRNCTRLEYLWNFPKSTTTEVNCCLENYRKTRKLCKIKVKKSGGGL